jgi:ribonuclease HII
MMAELAPAYPAYGWDVNKGYATPEHLAALNELGASEHHRRSWRLPPYDDLLPTGAPAAGDGSAVSDPAAMGDDERVWEVSVP